MEYYYAPPEKRHGDTLIIDGQEFLHLSQVMRKTPGDRLTAVDGCGTAYAVAIREIAHRTAYCDILETMPRLHEPGTEVTLGVALLKHGASFDYIVEKVTELGVSRIVPLLTERTVRRHGRNDRWEHLALAAMKQCGRCLVPAILPVTGFAEFLQGFPPEAVKCIPHEKILEPSIGDYAGGAEHGTGGAGDRSRGGVHGGGGRGCGPRGVPRGVARPSQAEDRNRCGGGGLVGGQRRSDLRPDHVEVSFSSTIPCSTSFIIALVFNSEATSSLFHPTKSASPRLFRLMRTFSAAPWHAAWSIKPLTPASLTELTFPLAATSWASARASMQCFITSSGTSVASFVASRTAAARSAFWGSVSFGRPKASITLLNATVSFVRQVQELLAQGLRLGQDLLHVLLDAGVFLLADGQVADHGDQGRPEGPGESGNAPAAGSRR